MKYFQRSASRAFGRLPIKLLELYALACLVNPPQHCCSSATSFVLKDSQVRNAAPRAATASPKRKHKLTKAVYTHNRNTKNTQSAFRNFNHYDPRAVVAWLAFIAPISYPGYVAALDYILLEGTYTHVCVFSVVYSINKYSGFFIVRARF